jgi:D-lactate dehydrogenase (cytochrome)
MIYKDKQDEIQNYLSDASNFRGNADQVIIPETTRELIQAIRSCSNKKQPVTLAGAKTGLAGGCVPLEGVVVSTERLNKVLEINIADKYAIVEPGLLLSELEEGLRKTGLFYPPNPTEKNSSVGGNIATNASGSRTFKYGATRDYIEELDLVFADGDTATITRGENYFFGNLAILNTDSDKRISISIDKNINMPEIKHSAGYFLKSNMDMIDLFIGGEGSLAVVSRAKLKLLEKPSNVLGMIIYFDDEAKLLDFVDLVREESKKSFDVHLPDSKISARLIEYFDHFALNIIREDYPEIPAEVVGAIWIEQEYEAIDEDRVLENWYKLISEYTSLQDLTWTALNDTEHEKMKDFRHALPLKVTDYLSQNNQIKIATDAAVPDYNFKKYYSEIIDILKKSNCNYLIYGHIGNSHLHANILPGKDDIREELLPIYDDMIEIALKYGGTVSAEHGIGKIKKKYLRKMFSDEGIETMLNIKKVLDPEGLLSKGNLF